MAHQDGAALGAILRHRGELQLRLLDAGLHVGASAAADAAGEGAHSFAGERVRDAPLSLRVVELGEHGLAHRGPGQGLGLLDAGLEIFSDERAILGLGEMQVQRLRAHQTALERGLGSALGAVPTFEVVERGAEAVQWVRVGVADGDGRAGLEQRLDVEPEELVRVLGPPAAAVSQGVDEEVRQRVPRGAANADGVGVDSNQRPELLETSRAECFAQPPKLGVGSVDLGGQLLEGPGLQLGRELGVDARPLADLPVVLVEVVLQRRGVEEPHGCAPEGIARRRLAAKERHRAFGLVQGHFEIGQAEQSCAPLGLIFLPTRCLEPLRGRLRGLLVFLVLDQRVDLLPGQQWGCVHGHGEGQQDGEAGSGHARNLDGARRGWVPKVPGGP